MAKKVLINEKLIVHFSNVSQRQKNWLFFGILKPFYDELLND